MLDDGGEGAPLVAFKENLMSANRFPEKGIPFFSDPTIDHNISLVIDYFVSEFLFFHLVHFLKML